MTDLPLFAARRTDPATSHVAAHGAARFAGDHRARILAVLDRPGTIYEIGQRCGLDHVRVDRRMKELERAGRAEPTGETRPSPSGSPCTVWRKL